MAEEGRGKGRRAGPTPGGPTRAGPPPEGRKPPGGRATPGERPPPAGSRRAGPGGAAGAIACLPDGFEDEGLLRQALTHVSGALEEARAGGPKPKRRRGLSREAAAAADSYERLEFLGDRVLGLAVAERLYEIYPEEPEGELSKRLHSLVSRRALGVVARRLGLDRFILRAEGHEVTESMLADCFEAVLGAVHLDGGWEAAREFALCALRPDLEALPVRAPSDPKTTLQELSMARGLGLPIYEQTGRTGPEHDPVFEVSVRLAGLAPVGRGSGGRLREAERRAAAQLQAALSGPGGPDGPDGPRPAAPGGGGGAPAAGRE